MSKVDKGKPQERVKVDPLGDMKIAEAKGIPLLTYISNIYFNHRVFGASEERDL